MYKEQRIKAEVTVQRCSLGTVCGFLDSGHTMRGRCIDGASTDILLGCNRT